MPIWGPLLHGFLPWASHGPNHRAGLDPLAESHSVVLLSTALCLQGAGVEGSGPLPLGLVHAEGQQPVLPWRLRQAIALCAYFTEGEVASPDTLSLTLSSPRPSALREHSPLALTLPTPWTRPALHQGMKCLWTGTNPAFPSFMPQPSTQHLLTWA